MDKYETAKKLMQCFPGSFINNNGEFIAHAKSNTYLVFENCHKLQDLQCKILEWLSRAAYKTQPYRSTQANDKYHRFMLDGINKFLGTDFTFADMELIYTRLGNEVNPSLTAEFVKSGYSMKVLQESQQNLQNLTEKRGGTVYYVGKHRTVGVPDCASTMRVAAIRDVMQRLADYEATGLEPEQIAKLEREAAYV